MIDFIAAHPLPIILAYSVAVLIVVMQWNRSPR